MSQTMPNVLISARGLKIRFGGVIAADGIDLDVLDGENLAIIGPNGAGKTTFLNMTTGYLRPQAGTVSFLGKDITALPPRTITKMGVARAFQIPQLFLEQTVMENMLMSAAARTGQMTGLRRLMDLPERAEMEALLDLVGVRAFADRRTFELPEGSASSWISLWLGLEAARAADGRAHLRCRLGGEDGDHGYPHQCLKRQKVSSVFVEHDMEMVERYASRVACGVGQDPDRRPACGSAAERGSPRTCDRDLSHAELRQGQCHDRRRPCAAPAELHHRARRDLRADRP